MSRSSRGRLIVTGSLVATSPIHVGGRHGEDGIDLALARDGAGHWYVPGTSLAGPIRSWFEHRFPDLALSNQLLGLLLGPRYQRGADEGSASLLTVEDAAIRGHNGTDPVAEIRDNVGIDRRTGSAHVGIKFDRAVLPAGTRLDLRLVVELPERVRNIELPPGIAAHDGIAALTGRLVAALQAGEIGVGAARTRGLGDVRLEQPVIVERTTTRRSMLDALAATDIASAGTRIDPVELIRRAETIEPAADAGIDVVVSWHADGPLMVRAGEDGLAIDNLPLVTTKDDRLVMVLPGSSLKGALRSCAERLVRTIRSSNANDGPHHEQVRERLVDELFGAPGDDAENREGAEDGERADVPSGRPRLGRGAITAYDTTAQPMPEKAWRAVTEAIEPGQAVAALDAGGFTAWTAAHHVAIDRWTGGAGDAFLFTTLEPGLVNWQPLRLRFDPTRVPAELRAASLGLLLLVLDEMTAGRIPLGYATHRGLGAVSVERVELRCAAWEQAGLTAAIPSPLILEGPVLASLGADLHAELAAAWSDCWQSAP